jgi:hypothetical protein
MLATVEDVVAVALELEDGSLRYLLTWGRTIEPVDTEPLEQLVLQHCRRFALGGEPVGARVCRSLREAAESSEAPYFFDHLLWFASHPIPFGDGYEAWRAEREDQQRQGREIRYCGRPWSTG